MQIYIKGLLKATLNPSPVTGIYLNLLKAI